MPSEWIDTTIGEQVTLQRGIDITKAEQRPGSVPVISSGGILSYHDTSAVRGPGVVLGRKGVVGSVYFVEADYWPHDTTLWAKDFHGNDPRFVYYFFRWMAPQLARMDVGSANPTLNRNHVHPITVRWPPVREQQAIADILGALDDKIKLNQRTNESLEALVRALFKAWFIDFQPVRAKISGATGFPGVPAAIFDRLPNQLIESTLGPIPEGWKIASTLEIADYVNGKAFTQYADGQGRMIIRIAELNNGAGIATKYSSIDADVQYTAFPDDVLFAWSGSLGVYRWHRDEALINQHIFKVIPKAHPKWYVYYRLIGAMPYFQAIASTKATTMGHIQRGHLSEALFPEPPTSLIEAADALIVPSFTLIHNNERQSLTLRAIRDALLPKLMSGKIRLLATGEVTDGR